MILITGCALKTVETLPPQTPPPSHGTSASTEGARQAPTDPKPPEPMPEADGKTAEQSPDTSPITEKAPQKIPDDTGAEPSPRYLASLQLTKQGRLFLESNRPDQAIRILERAVGIDPTNGENYYYLAEAWILKKNLNQAGEFNRLADIYLKKNDQWKARLLLQRNRIQAGE